jgi:polysaccharide export outer membrane protein
MAIGVRTLCLSIALSSAVFGVALTGGCAGTGYDYSKEPDPRKKEYVIGVGDGLRITVWKNAELFTETHVRPDGTITMPLMGDIRAADRTPSQLTEDIATRLKTFVKEENAVVSIAVSEVNSYRFTVSGNVEHAGVMSLKYYATVSDAIAQAGGINKFGSTTKIVLLRKLPNGGVRKIPINFDRISRGDHPEENIVILAGDTLYVP